MIHKFGCKCKKCTHVDIHCPKCGKGYGKSNCFECPFCGYEWNEGDEFGFQSWLASVAAFDSNLQQIIADGKRLEVI